MVETKKELERKLRSYDLKIKDIVSRLNCIRVAVKLKNQQLFDKQD